MLAALLGKIWTRLDHYRRLVYTDISGSGPELI